MKLGIFLIFLGLGAIAAGIILKRLLSMGEYLHVLHTMGGLLMATGACAFFIAREKAKD
jgi:hypothetical protein